MSRRVDYSKAALLINECQRGTLEKQWSDFPELIDQVTSRDIFAKIAVLADAFRAAGRPVFHLHIAHQPDYADVPITNLILARSKKFGRMKIGTPEADAVPALTPKPGDIVHTRSYSLVAFHGTDLDTVLRHRGINTVVLVGPSTNVAIPGLGLYASDMGYQAVVPEDCIAGASAESHAFIVKNILPLYTTLTTSQSIAEALRGAS